MKNNRTIRKVLLMLAATLFVATLGTWVATGAHRGWSKTTVTEMHTDEFTGIEYPVERDAFVAGLEFVAVGLAGSLVLGASSLVVRSRSTGRA
ncbi:hypothetical protein [Congregicoccus parvus]|uniref:hypothetical protein n=1 Tax=Congregicoccus parvus TaxID=3081749 RepID=UPI003FA52B48